MTKNTQACLRDIGLFHALRSRGSSCFLFS